MNKKYFTTVEGLRLVSAYFSMITIGFYLLVSVFSRHGIYPEDNPSIPWFLAIFAAISGIACAIPGHFLSSNFRQKNAHGKSLINMVSLVLCLCAVAFTVIAVFNPEPLFPLKPSRYWYQVSLLVWLVISIGTKIPAELMALMRSWKSGSEYFFA